MDDSKHSIRTIFNEALEIDDARQRADYLSRACGADSSLRTKIEELIQAHAAAGGFLDLRGKAGSNPQSTAIDPIVREEPGSIIGRYKLLEKLGEGGFGAVYVAEQREPVKRRVALKIIKLGMDTRQVVARFEAERQALALMDHPNIAKVLDAGATETGRPYFVMELVRGIPITKYCDENNLPTVERLKLFTVVCHAIQHAHQKGIIHRDIKPSNILVTLHDGVPVPKVIDFGIAKATEGRLTDKTIYTELHQFIGTPAYMSPEQAEMSGLDIDTRSDIYALGVLLYELLTSKTPFDAKELREAGLDAMRRTIREQEPARPSTRLSTLMDADRTMVAKAHGADMLKLITLVRGDLDWIVMKALEKDRTRRYETANGLATDIQRHLSHEPVAACPPSNLYRFQKLVRRNKLVFVAASSVALTLIAGLSFSMWSFLRERAAHAEAEKGRQEAVKARTGETTQRQRAEANARIAKEQEKFADQQKSLAEANAKQATESAQYSRLLLYDADLNLAQQALKANNLGRARRLLDRQRPSTLQPQLSSDLRGWEWRYLWQQCRSDAESRLCKFNSGVTSLSFAPDGDRFVAKTHGSVEAWSLRNRQPLGMLTTNFVYFEAVFSPAAPLLAWDTDGGTIVVTNLATRAHWRLETDARFAYKLAFSPNGRRLAALLVDDSAKLRMVIWETDRFAAVSTNELGFRLESRNTGGAIRWASNSEQLWVGGGLATDGLVVELPAEGGLPLRKFQAHPANGISALAVSPSGDKLATGAGFADSTVKIWDAQSGQFLKQLEGHAAYIGALAFSPDGRWLASGSADQTVRLWNTADWQSTVLRGHSDEVHALAFTPDGALLASGSRDGEVLLWRTNSYRPRGAREPLPAGVVNASKTETPTFSFEISWDACANKPKMPSSNASRSWSDQEISLRSSGLLEFRLLRMAYGAFFALVFGSWMT